MVEGGLKKDCYVEFPMKSFQQIKLYAYLEASRTFVECSSALRAEQFLVLGLSINLILDQLAIDQNGWRQNSISRETGSKKFFRFEEFAGRAKPLKILMLHLARKKTLH